MHVSTISLGTCAFAALASAHTPLSARHRNNIRSTGIALELSQEGATDVRASVSNTGSEAVRLFTDGTILDQRGPVQRLEVSQGDTPVQFLGVIAEYNLNDLTEDSFVTLQPGESTDATVNLPSLYNLAGGDYDVSLANTFEYAAADSTELSGLYEFASNRLTFSIDSATAAAAVAKREAAGGLGLNLDKRVITEACEGAQATALTDAIGAVQGLASAAGDAAGGAGDPAKLQEYFPGTTAEQGTTISENFAALAQEAASTTEGQISYSCTDYAGICGQGNVIAYAQPSTGQMANCPLFYELPATSTGCGDQSQAATVLHEFTHVLAGTSDYAYGYSRSTSLSASQAIDNADK